MSNFHTENGSSPAKNTPPVVGGTADAQTQTVRKVYEDLQEGVHSETRTRNPNKKIKSSAGQNQLNVKSLGTTSTAFIGPACRPEPVQSKPDIEDTLTAFYQELEQLEQTDDVDASTTDVEEVIIQPLEALNPPIQENMLPSSQGKSPGPNPPCLPHWDQNDGSPLPKRPRPLLDSNSHSTYSAHHQYYPTPPYRRPYPRSHRPPPGPMPLPFPGFNGPPDRPPQVHRNSNYPSRTNPYHRPYMEPPPPFSRFPPHFNRVPPPSRPPPPNISCYSHGFDGAPLYRSDRDWGGRGCDDRSSYENGEWSVVYEGPKSENNQGYDGEHDPVDTTSDSSLVLILMRGVPGSGKSTLARELVRTGSNGVILSTDDYFSQEQGYAYDPSLIPAAHQWNQNQAKKAMLQGCSPVIIDNTNIRAWEMKPYVEMAVEKGYRVSFREPHTRWKHDPMELERRNKHGVPWETIAKMIDRFESPVSVAIVMSSKQPAHKRLRVPPQQPEQDADQHRDKTTEPSLPLPPPLEHTDTSH